MRPQRDAKVAVHRELTIEWWQHRRDDFELFTSEVVVAEAERGDDSAVEERRAILRQTQRLSASSAAEELVPELLAATGLPPKVFADMAHVALATVHGIFAPRKNSWESKAMWSDPIVEETRKARAEAFGGTFTSFSRTSVNVNVKAVSPLLRFSRILQKFSLSQWRERAANDSQELSKRRLFARRPSGRLEYRLQTAARRLLGHLNSAHAACRSSPSPCGAALQLSERSLGRFGPCGVEFQDVSPISEMATRHS